jgi:hypothetical protein
MFSYRDNLIVYTEHVALGEADKDLSVPDRAEVVHQLRVLLNYYAEHRWAMEKHKAWAYAGALQEKAAREGGLALDSPANRKVLSILLNISGPEV